MRGPALDPRTLAPLLRPMPRRELRVAALARHYATVEGLASALGLTFHTTRQYIHQMASKIPGDLPSHCRVRVWARGATLTVLQGHE